VARPGPSTYCVTALSTTCGGAPKGLIGRPELAPAGPWSGTCPVPIRAARSKWCRRPSAVVVSQGKVTSAPTSSFAAASVTAAGRRTRSQSRNKSAGVGQHAGFALTVHG
jgi:hypothetical protein